MKKVRREVFETNSSSTHSICIAKTGQVRLPQNTTLIVGEFGWEVDAHYDAQTKASYLYTGLLGNGRTEDVDKLVTILEKNGVSVYRQEPKKTSWGSDYGYVDHADELNEFLDAVMSDEALLLRFLFLDSSFVETGNDNDEIENSGAPDETHITFYKGN